MLELILNFGLVLNYRISYINIFFSILSRKLMLILKIGIISIFLFQQGTIFLDEFHFFFEEPLIVLYGKLVIYHSGVVESVA